VTSFRAVSYDRLKQRRKRVGGLVWAYALTSLSLSSVAEIGALAKTRGNAERVTVPRDADGGSS